VSGPRQVIGLDITAARHNRDVMSYTVSECAYDVSDGWLRDFNIACDKFLLSRGLDPSEGSHISSLFIEENARKKDC
jgi:hypothetical protein